MERISRPDLFMETARLFARRSTCTRGQVGAVIVRDRHIIAHGYNGAPSGMPDCLELGCEVVTLFKELDSPEPQYSPVELGCQRAIHAEANAVAYAAKVGVSCQDAVIYSTHEPCRKCAELIVQAGIIQVVFENPYRLGASQFIRAAGIGVEQHQWQAYPA